LYINLSGIFYSERYGYDQNDILFRSNALFLFGSFVGYRNLVNGLDLVIGVNDLLNAQYQFIQAYRSGNNPMPGPGREFSLKFRYNINFKQ
jgi:hypothetical protein